MLTDSEEVDFDTEIVTGEDGSFTLESTTTEEEDTEQEETTKEEEESEETESDEDSETEEEETETEDNSFKPFEATINGQKIKIENAEEAQKIINNLSKPKSQEPNIWDQAQKELGVTTKDLALISAIKSGDKDALLFAAKEGGLDISQLIYDEAPTNFDKDFTPKVQTEGERVINEMTSSGELTDFSAIIEGTDENFIQNLSDVKNLNAFRQQVASGKAAELMPLARKMSALEGITLFEAYAKVGHEQKSTEAKKVVDRATTKKTPPIKKATKSGSQAKTSDDDIWGMDDAEFDAKYGGRKI